MYWSISETERKSEWQVETDKGWHTYNLWNSKIHAAASFDRIDWWNFYDYLKLVKGKTKAADFIYWILIAVEQTSVLRDRQNWNPFLPVVRSATLYIMIKNSICD